MSARQSTENDHTRLQYPSRSGVCQNMRRHAAHDYDAGHGEWWSCPGVGVVTPHAKCGVCEWDGCPPGGCPHTLPPGGASA